MTLIKDIRKTVTDTTPSTPLSASPTWLWRDCTRPVSVPLLLVMISTST